MTSIKRRSTKIEKKKQEKEKKVREYVNIDT
jgi:hypothetical protein